MTCCKMLELPMRSPFARAHAILYSLAVSSGLKPLQEPLVVSALSQLSCSSSGKPSSGIASSGMPSAYSSPPIPVTTESCLNLLTS